MFGVKKLGTRLATWLDERSKQYKIAAGGPGLDARTIDRLNTVALVLEEVSSGVKNVTGAADVEEG